MLLDNIKEFLQSFLFISIWERDQSYQKVELISICKLISFICFKYHVVW